FEHHGFAGCEVEEPFALAVRRAFIVGPWKARIRFRGRPREGIRAKKASDAQDEDPQGELDRRILAPGHGTSTLSPVPGSLDRARWTGHRALLDEDDAPFSRRIRSG